MRIYSIGYERKSINEVCELLESAGVGRLVDVRHAAWSQRPQFRREALRAALEARGIEYVHCKVAGNPFRPPRGETPDLDQCRSDFARHLEANPSIIATLNSLTTERPSALFCYEVTRHRCHRGVLLQAMSERDNGLDVIDLGDGE